MEQIRSFIAIELPEEIKTGLTQLQAQLKSGNQPGVKWVDPNSIHLTLKFLGNIAIDSIGAINRAIEEAVQGASPFRLEIKDPGAFPNLKRVQVVWVGVGGEVDKLARLQQRLESNLAGLGFAPETRRFTPHLTLARLRPQALPEEQRRLGQLITETKSNVTSTFRVDAISLMRSQLTREGAIYHRISSVALNKPLSTTTV